MLKFKVKILVKIYIKNGARMNQIICELFEFWFDKNLTGFNLIAKQAKLELNF